MLSPVTMSKAGRGYIKRPVKLTTLRLAPQLTLQIPQYKLFLLHSHRLLAPGCGARSGLKFCRPWHRQRPSPLRSRRTSFSVETKQHLFNISHSLPSINSGNRRQTCSSTSTNMEMCIRWKKKMFSYEFHKLYVGTYLTHMYLWPFSFIWAVL